MPTIEIKQGLRLNTDDFINVFAELENKSLNCLMGHIQQAIYQKQDISKEVKEQQLLTAIHKVLPKSVLCRFRQLRHKLHSGVATEKEVEELQFLSDLLEEKTAERLVLLKDLAALKQWNLNDSKARIKLADWYA